MFYKRLFNILGIATTTCSRSFEEFENRVLKVPFFLNRVLSRKNESLNLNTEKEGVGQEDHINTGYW